MASVDSTARPRSRAGLAELLADARDRLVASDPGLSRLSMAVTTVAAVGSTLLVEWVFATVTGQIVLIAMLMGAVVSMMGMMALSDPTMRGRVVTAVFIPVAIAVGVVPGTAIAPHHTLTLVLFVVVMFAAVFVRRFGVRFFYYGFMAWMGYFFSVFLGLGWAVVPGLLGAVVVATAWLLLLKTTVFRGRPRAILTRTLGAFWIRGRRAIDAAAELIDNPGSVSARRRVHRGLIQITEAALLVDGQLGDSAAVPHGRSPAAVRGWMIDAELAFDTLSGSARRIADNQPNVPTLTRARVRALLQAVSDGDSGETRRLGAVLESDRVAADVRALVLAARELDRMRQHWHAIGDTAAPDDAAFEPAVTLFGGNLPGNAVLARTMIKERTHHRWNPLGYLDLTTRQAVQVAVATGLAILVGTLLDPDRYYWAVIAAFVVFTGTTTVAETARKAVSRAVGTLVGLGASIILAEATAGEPAWAIAVILISLFLGFYLQRLSYGAMIFFITIMVGQLYTMLNEFSGGLLVLRLEETAIGAMIGIAVSLLVLPTGTRDTARAARKALLDHLGELLEQITGQLNEPASRDSDTLAGTTRTVDATLQQYLIAVRPLTWPMVFGSDNGTVRHRGLLLTYAASDARRLARLVTSTPSSDTDAAAATGLLAKVFRTLAVPGPLGDAGAVQDDLDTAHGRIQALESSPVRHRLEHLHDLLDRYLKSIPAPRGIAST